MTTVDLDAKMKTIAEGRRLVNLILEREEPTMRASILLGLLVEQSVSLGPDFASTIPEMFIAAVDAVFTAGCGCCDCKKTVATALSEQKHRAAGAS